MSCRSENWRLPVALICVLMTSTLGSMLRGEQNASDPSDPDARTSIVSGTVRMPDGQTAAIGADVHLLRRSDGAYTLPVKTQKTTTDQQGRFIFSQVQAGNYKVWAETSKLTTLEKKLGGEPLSVGENGNAVMVDDLVLHDGCHYRVTVVSAVTGEPLPSGRVWFGWTDLPREYHAGDDGVVEIGGLAVDDWYFVVAADGHGIEYKKIPQQPLGSTTELTFKLDVGGDLVGVVQTDAGQPVDGADVSASSSEGGMTPGYGRVKTDKDGRFVLKNLPAGVAIRIGASKKDHSRASENVAIAAGKQQTSISLICNPRPYGGDCIVTVVDENDKPIAAAALRNDGSSSADHRDAETDENGVGRLVNMYSNHRGHQVTVRAKGYITQEIEAPPGTAEDPSTVTVTMQPGKVLRGRVLDPEGKPAPRVRVYYNEGEHGWSLGGRVDTDSDGKFQIDGLPEQSTLTVYTPRQFAPINDQPVTAGLGEPLTITMQLAAVVRVRAIDQETGKSIPEFNVRVRNSPDRGNGEPWGSFSTSYSEQGTNILGEQTEFEMGHLNEGTPLQITVSAKDYLPTVLRRVLAVRSDKAELIDVPLKRDSPENYQMIRGTLRDGDGKPVVGAIVKLIVGKVDPVSPQARTRGGSSDNWRFYHWDIIRSGQIATSEHCLQFLSTATDAKGEFEFSRVRKNGPWIELFYVGRDVAPRRYSDLRRTHADSLADLQLTAESPSSLRLFVDRKKWPEAHAIRLDVPFYTQYPDCLERPFSSQTETIDATTNEVKFLGLPPGVYQVTVEGKPVPVGRGGFQTSPLGSYSIQMPAGEEMKGDL